LLEADRARPYPGDGGDERHDIARVTGQEEMVVGDADVHRVERDRRRAGVGWPSQMPCCWSPRIQRSARFTPTLTVLRREALIASSLTDVVEVVLHLRFEQLGLRRVVAGCFAANIASWSLMERVGCAGSNTP
jgi:hypothetical protein